jgi:hypothetical protein
MDPTRSKSEPNTFGSRFKKSDVWTSVAKQDPGFGCYFDFCSRIQNPVPVIGLDFPDPDPTHVLSSYRYFFGLKMLKFFENCLKSFSVPVQKIVWTIQLGTKPSTIRN